MNFAPTHRVPESGLSTWPSADADEPNAPRLSPGLEVQVLALSGQRARVLCSNGWETWVTADRLLVAGPPAAAPSAAHRGLPFVVAAVLVPVLAAVVVVVIAALVIASRGGDEDNATTNTLGCGVTTADVQALLPANSGVTEHSTGDAAHCRFTWDDNGQRTIDVARVPGGRASFEAQSLRVPDGPTTLRNGRPYESLAELGEMAWAYGDGRLTTVHVLRGTDLVTTTLLVEGASPAGPKSPTGMDANSLEICQALTERALD